MKTKKFKFLEHTADIKFRAYGRTIEKAYENSAFALKECICGKLKIKEEVTKKINIIGEDFESLLYNFLEEFLYLLDAENFLLNKIKKIKINKKNFSLIAFISGDDAKNYQFVNNVKAVTYNDMFVKKQKNGWITQVVVDV